MRFAAKKNAGCLKAPCDFPPRKNGILLPPSGCLGTPLPNPKVCMYGPTDGRSLTSEPRFLASKGYLIFLPMVLRCARFARGSSAIISSHSFSHTPSKQIAGFLSASAPGPHQVYVEATMARHQLARDQQVPEKQTNRRAKTERFKQSQQHKGCFKSLESLSQTILLDSL